MALIVATPCKTVKSRHVAQGRKHAKYEMKTRFAGMPGYVDSGPIRAYIEFLTTQGMPLASIARDAGVRYHCVYNIHHGVWTTTRIRQATAIRAVDWHPNARQETVPALGAIRRLRALHALGWTWRALSEHSGLNMSVITKIADPARRRVNINWDTWSTIRDLYEDLSGTVAPKGKGCTQSRNHSRRKGWPPPLDWYDLDIDDPRVTAKRSGLPRGNGTDERAEWRRGDVARLTRLGLSVSEIAVRVGVSERQVERDRQCVAGGGSEGDGEAA